ncbi:MAG TPA: CDP-alcohol phosphatidyltransferase family protein [Gemmatimonadales bacterium]|nr:CDP-alcohol phosphatidyltransferase family protein [Gemmatimonadales bacterium]
MQLTAAVQQGYKATTKPLTNWLIRARVTPNAITTVAALVVVVSAIAFGIGWVRLGGGLLLLSGVMDTLDGDVARAAGQATKFGAFYDSTLDRLGDGVTFIGIATFLLTTTDIRYPVVGAVLCMVAVLASLLVSYARARAEGLGLECKVGVVQRAERILLIGIPSLVVGAGPGALVLQTIVALLALGSIITVVQRFLYVRRVTQNGAL